MTTDTNTKASHPRMALRRCWTLQRPDTSGEVVVGLGLGGAALSSHGEQLPLSRGRVPMRSDRRLRVRFGARRGCGYRTGEPYSKRIRAGRLAHAKDARGHARDDGVGRHVARDHRVRADHGVVADRHAAQDAGAVADPDVVAHAHVALVDALEPDRAVHLDHPVVEVDQHHAVGDHALAPDRHVLERGDRALLARARSSRRSRPCPRGCGSCSRARPTTSGPARASLRLPTSRLHPGPTKASPSSRRRDAEAQLRRARAARSAGRTSGSASRAGA